jgi:hypothetical protein
MAKLVLPPEMVCLPAKLRQATLVDLLDRALDKGVVISADLVVSLAGIPLVGVNLRAAVAGMETMLRYGLMRDWDERIRDWESKRVDQSEPALLANERMVLRTYGALWAARGIYRAWRPGHLYVTNRRLILFRAQPPETLLDMPLHSVKGYSVRKGTHFTGHERDLVYVALRSGDAVCLHSDKHEDLLSAMATEMEGMGLSLVEETAAPFAAFAGEVAPLMVGETIKGESKMWRQVPQLRILGDTWRPGRLYLTECRLIWWCDTDRRVQLEVPVERLAGADVESMDLGGLIGERPVLTLRYRSGHGLETALLTGDGLWEWKRAIEALAKGTEACSRCGGLAPSERLLEQGCPGCDWTHRDAACCAPTTPAGGRSGLLEVAG